MVGCCFNCQFCSAKRTFKRHLSKEELLGQVDFLIQQGKKYGRSTDPMESQEFHVLYTRMGEPCANIDNVIASIQELIKRYPHVKIGMSTNGYKDGVYQFFDYPEIIPHIMMQFSVHATDDATRSKVLGMENNYAGFMDLAETSTYIKEFRKINPRMVSLNFILLEGIKYDF
jgi:adenine C2-methylase RlmN of 23S rRNA A2503 and tRNA A37